MAEVASASAATTIRRFATSISFMRRFYKNDRSLVIQSNKEVQAEKRNNMDGRLLFTVKHPYCCAFPLVFSYGPVYFTSDRNT